MAFPSEIYPEWEAMVFPPAPIPREEKVARANALYDRCFREGRWQVSVIDASLISLVVLSHAMQDRDHARAVVVANRFLEHPDRPADSYVREHTYRLPEDEFRCMLGAAQFLLGERRAGVEELMRVLEAGPCPAQTRRHIVRNNLICLCSDMPDGEAIGGELAELVRRLLAGWRGQRRKAQRVGEGMRFGELREVLESTYARPRS